MKELSLNILDIAQNSLKADATLIGIDIEETADTLRFTIEDDGRGMDRQFLEKVTDPFTTTRTTRRVGLGLPLLKMEAEMTGGEMTITSQSERESKEHGTRVTALFKKSSIDYIPLGDIVGTLCVLVQGLGETDLAFCHQMTRGRVELSTKSLKEVLGDVPLDNPEVLGWIRSYLEEQYENTK